MSCITFRCVFFTSTWIIYLKDFCSMFAGFTYNLHTFLYLFLDLKINITYLIEEVLIQVILYYSHIILFSKQMNFLFCFWMSKKSRKEVYSSVPRSANFRSTSVVPSALAHKNSIWTAILNASLLKTSFWTQNIEHYIQFWGWFYSHEISFSKFRNEAFLV